MPISPIIGICAAWDIASWGFWSQPAGIVADTYVNAVRRAGGLPLALIPIALGEGEARALTDRVDGLLLIGGSDIEPAAYGAEAEPGLEATSPLRDQFELGLVAAALGADLPILGICRGLQVLNVATGGTLHQDLDGDGFADHRRVPGGLDERTAHEVEVSVPSLLGGADAAAVQTVNSHHHQAIDQLGAGGRVVARAVEDGLIEAVEWPAHTHVLGVQWHPEALSLDSTVASLVNSAGQKRTTTSLEVQP